VNVINQTLVILVVISTGYKINGLGTAEVISIGIIQEVNIERVLIRW